MSEAKVHHNCRNRPSRATWGLNVLLKAASDISHRAENKFGWVTSKFSTCQATTAIFSHAWMQWPFSPCLTRPSPLWESSTVTTGFFISRLLGVLRNKPRAHVFISIIWLPSRLPKYLQCLSEKAYRVLSLCGRMLFVTVLKVTTLLSHWTVTAVRLLQLVSIMPQSVLWSMW